MPARSPFQTPPRPQTNYQFPDDPGVPLACPVCRAALIRDGQRFVCRGRECRRAYLIRDGIPLLLESESVMLTTEDWSKVAGV